MARRAPLSPCVVRDLPLESGAGDGAGGRRRRGARSADCGRCSRSWGRFPPSPTTSRSAVDDEEVGWRLCELAPLTLIDRQRLLACTGVAEQMELLCELSTAMADDVVSLLAGGLGR